MKLSIALLPIIGVALLSSCSKLEATCSGEDSLKLATQIISEDAEKYLTEQKVGDYDPEYNMSEDYELWLRIGTHYKLANLPDFTTKYRHNNKSISTTKGIKQ